jgi:hypothetical protein
MNVALLILPILFCGFMMMCMCCLIVLAPAMTQGSGTGDETLNESVDVEPLNTQVEDVSGPTTSDGCFQLLHHANGEGGGKEWCLDGDENKLEVTNLKPYGINDGASSVAVGRGVTVELYPNANFGATTGKANQRPFKVKGPNFVVLGDKWSDDVASSFKMWKTK